MRGMCSCSCAEVLLNVDSLSKTMISLQFDDPRHSGNRASLVAFESFNVTVVHTPGGGGHYSKLRRIAPAHDLLGQPVLQTSLDWYYGKNERVSHLMMKSYARKLGLDEVS